MSLPFDKKAVKGGGDRQGGDSREDTAI